MTKFSTFYLEVFSCHNLCSLVLRFLIVQWLPFSTPVRSDFRRPPLSLDGKFFKLPFNFKLTCTLWYIGSYTIMAKPIKSLELHYPIIDGIKNCIIIHVQFKSFIDFCELRSQKTVHFLEQIMSTDKYPTIFLPQMEATVYLFIKTMLYKYIIYSYSQK